MDINEIKSELEKMVPAFAHKVQPIYELLEWRWGPELSGKLFIPTIRDIEKTLKILISGLANDVYKTASGGLAVFCEKKKDKTYSAKYGMEFILRETVFF